jgi:hypothetical protein
MRRERSEGSTSFDSLTKVRVHFSSGHSEWNEESTFLYLLSRGVPADVGVDPLHSVIPDKRSAIRDPCPPSVVLMMEGHPDPAVAGEGSTACPSVALAKEGRLARSLQLLVLVAGPQTRWDSAFFQEIYVD